MSSISKIGETNSLLPKPSKTASSSIPSSTTTAKRDSAGTGCVKSECGSSKLATGKGTQRSKASVLSGARRVLPKPAVSSKSSLLGSLTTSGMQSMRSSTSSDSSSNMSSGTPAKSTLATARRNPGNSANVGTGPSGAIPRTPSRAALKNKPPPSTQTPSRAALKNKPPSSTLSTYLMSTKISSNVSPASSISEWSSASSTSSTIVNQRSNNSRTSLDTNSRKPMNSDIVPLDPKNHSADRTTGRLGNQGPNLTTNNARKSSTQTGTLQAPVKPSGLRMPSPKIGYFDGVKSSGRTPTGQKQSLSGLQTLFPRNGAATCSPKQSSNGKVKGAKVQTARTATSLANTKPSSPKATSPASCLEKSHALVKTSSVSEDSPSLSPAVKCNATGENCLKAEEVQAEDGSKQVHPSTSTIVEENLGDLNVHKNMGIENIKTASVEDSNCPSSENIDQMDILVNQNHLKKNSHPICEAAGKENSPVNYQGEGWTIDSGDPFPLKNFTSSNESIDMSKESTAQVAVVVAVADKTGFLLPSSEQLI
ncbi:hypothetical protein CDL12_22378 [Handroanthus impetiginosus]|uniref:Uncharacterized protein n=1 Tax=Handroanthus impetiginosus TaxID=429701 RepID=A0A2G9GIQ9_9LAMI|nr:hypothetical protein CDL12_22378 [Handroanthus impetiginosus]